MKLLSWNVLADQYTTPERYPFLGEVSDRYGLVLDMVRSFDADIVCLQEVDQNLADRFHELEGYEFFWGSRKVDPAVGCLTAFKTLHITRTLYFSAGTQVAVISSSEDLVVANTHIKWADVGTPLADHIGVAQMRELCDTIKDSPRAIICGDINDWLGGPVRAVLEEYGFSQTQTPSPTAVIYRGAHWPYLPSFEEGPKLDSLDVVAVRGIAASVHTALVPDARMPGLHCPSDHLPLICGTI